MDSIYVEQNELLLMAFSFESLENVTDLRFVHPLNARSSISSTLERISMGSTADWLKEQSPILFSFNSLENTTDLRLLQLLNEYISISSTFDVISIDSTPELPKRTISNFLQLRIFAECD